MSWTITASQPVLNDPYLYTNTVLLLHGDGPNNSTSIIDSSRIAGSPKTVLAVGDAKISTAQSKFGNSSLSFVRSPSSYLAVSNASGDFTFGAGNFTIETFVYLNSMPTANGYPSSYWIIGGGPGMSNTGFDIAIGSSNLQVGLSNFASLNINVAHGISINTWHHVAVCRNADTLRAFRDGIQIGSANVSGVTADPMLSGIAISAAEPVGATLGNFDGSMDELRVTKGVARYTANFIAPTAAFPDF